MFGTGVSGGITRDFADYPTRRVHSLSVAQYALIESARPTVRTVADPLRHGAVCAGLLLSVLVARREPRPVSRDHVAEPRTRCECAGPTLHVDECGCKFKRGRERVDR